MSLPFKILEHIVHVVKVSVSKYRYRRLKLFLPQYALSLSKTLHSNCLSRLRCEMSSRSGHPHEGCFFGVMSSPEEIKVKNRTHVF